MVKVALIPSRKFCTQPTFNAFEIEQYLDTYSTIINFTKFYFLSWRFVKVDDTKGSSPWEKGKFIWGINTD